MNCDNSQNWSHLVLTTNMLFFSRLLSCLHVNRQWWRAEVMLTQDPPRLNSPLPGYPSQEPTTPKNKKYVSLPPHSAPWAPWPISRRCSDSSIRDRISWISLQTTVCIVVKLLVFNLSSPTPLLIFFIFKGKNTGTRKDYLTKPQHQAWEALFWAVSGLSKTPKSLLTIVIALGCPQRWKVSLIVKTPHTSEAGPKGLWAGSDLKASSLRTSLGPEGTMQASKGEKQPTALPNYDAYDPHQWPAWHSNPTGAVVAHVFWQ